MTLLSTTERKEKKKSQKKKKNPNPKAPPSFDPLIQM